MIDREVAGSREALADILGQPPMAFAYPNGDHDGRSRRAVSRAGYAVAFGFDHRLSPIPADDPYAISRLRMNEHASREPSANGGVRPAPRHPSHARTVMNALTPWQRFRDAAGRLSPRRRRWERFLQALPLDPSELEVPLAPPGRDDFIICGCPRTGTTLLAAVLFQPPRMVTCMEPWDGMRPPARRPVRVTP